MGTVQKSQEYSMVIICFKDESHVGQEALNSLPCVAKGNFELWSSTLYFLGPGVYTVNYQTQFLLWWEWNPKTSCMLSKHSTNWATSEPWTQTASWVKSALSFSFFQLCFYDLMSYQNTHHSAIWFRVHTVPEYFNARMLAFIHTLLYFRHIDKWYIWRI